jgi:hypothetical protein
MDVAAGFAIGKFGNCNSRLVPSPSLGTSATF